MKILLIEDSKPAVAIISILLKKIYPVASLEVANDGAKGIDLVCHKSYDLIFCDYQLPEFNGDKIVKKAKESLQPAKIIGISSSNQYNLRLVNLGAISGINKDEFLALMKLSPSKNTPEFQEACESFKSRINGLIK